MANRQLPNNPNILDTLGWIHYKYGNYSRAVSLLEESVRLAPQNSRLNYHLGMAYYQSGDAPAARRTLEKSLELGLDRAEAEAARQTLAALDQDGGN